MTAKMMADVAQVSVDTVNRKAKDLFPAKIFEKGKRVNFTHEESLAIMSELRKKGFVQPTQNAEVPTQNAEVARIDRLENMVEKLCLTMASLPQTIAAIAQSQNKQLEFIQDYYTIKGYASKQGVAIAYSDAYYLGKAASKLSREKAIEIRKADDEKFGVVNSYHVSVLKEVFTL